MINLNIQNLLIIYLHKEVCHETYKDLNGNWLYLDEIKITSKKGN